VDASALLIPQTQALSMEVKSVSRSTPSHAKPAACHPGLSYNPRTSDHQDIVAAAVAIELRREEAKSDRDQLVVAALDRGRNQPVEGEISSDDVSRSPHHLPLQSSIHLFLCVCDFILLKGI